MIILNRFSLISNKLISFLLAFSLLAATFSFASDENIRQEFSLLYKATSICEYYNSVTNFSYEVISKVLKSANVNLTCSSAKAKNSKKEKQNKTNSRLDFVQPNNENILKTFKSADSFDNILFFNNNFKFSRSEDISFINSFITLLFMVLLNFCYFARGNIDNIKFYNKTVKNRLV